MEADLVAYVDDRLAFHGTIPEDGVLPLVLEGFDEGVITSVLGSPTRRHQPRLVDSHQWIDTLD